MIARVLVVYKRSAYATWAGRGRSRLFKRLAANKSPIVAHMLRSHAMHDETLDRVRRALDDAGVEAVYRYRRHVGRVAGFGLVVTVGGDGTLLWASHALGDDIPVLSVNSAPGHSVGYFAGAGPGNVERRIRMALRGALPATRLTRMAVRVDGVEIERRVLNDVLFCHQIPAATTRYFVRFHGEEEEQKSSGIWIGPAAGSTAAQRSAGGRVLPASSRSLQFVVREPFKPRGGAYRFSRGLVTPGERFEIVSKIPAGRLFVDGAHRAYRVRLGEVVSLYASNEPLALLGFRRA